MSRRKRGPGRTYYANPPMGERVAAIEAELAHLATKADLSAEITKQTRWMIALMLGTVGTAVIAFLVDRLVN